MRIIKPHEGKSDPSQMAEAAVEPVVTASADRRPGGATAAHVPEQTGRRLGFLAGEVTVPPDFDRMGAAEIARRFEGEK